MTSKVDLRDIFYEHFATLKNVANGKLSWADVFVFYAIPAAVSGLVFELRVTLTAVAVGIIIGALAILVGLLINVLVLLYTVREVGPTDTETKERVALIKEVNANLIYEITIGIIDIVLLCGVRLLNDLWLHVGTAVVVFITGNFLVTLLMAVKRLKVLLGLRFR